VLSSQAQVKAKTYKVLLKLWVEEEIEGEDELIRELEEENKRVIPILKILHLRWLKKNQMKDMYRHMMIKLDYLETANQVIYRRLVHNIELKSAIRFDYIMQIQQCHKCQELEHSSRSCRRPWTYGHCADNHRTGSCTKKDDKKAV